ncbi:Cytochrome oxidase Cu insertion factor, SCO1/SenC/PrrC family [Pseudomonas koreensis]|uniref:Electron transporter SenC n=1 Tax=Pseudomonas koreensis TaxID=198620 RepID=A0AAC9FXX2_9PSED|nr:MULTISPECIES: SCO family protein [Pseudomonas]ANH98872.1 electron transporter SenC [Pseudomonas koreensis]KAB0509392.1 SCO family protein [Pseudomonas koreensis]MBB6153564.1 cytochrome oxidase Cu insertion factor (SCO1/SenC/PrrC family) [Pseudomonas sp. JAI115]NNA64447.1 SCO family protein [Pseudomonas koreensis]SDE21572.1 Cytochrome oxidase Cu insertion factor, SCO1/SenC/PrrC family [Pseudomonas koreensis]
MRLLDWISLTVCFWLLGNVAFAHEGHVSEPPTVVAAAPAKGTHDAKTWFTDTPLQDQNGETLRFYSDALQNRIVLLNVIFTSCNDACPLITRKLKEVRELLGDKAQDITFISLTSDPLRDTPAVLKAYTLKQGSDDPHWLFLTGDKAQMDLVLSRIGQIVPTPEQHSTQLIVGDVANKRWSKIRPDAPAAAIAQRLQLLTMPVAGR